MGTKKVYKKSVPKELTSLFRVHKIRNQVPRDKREVKKSQKYGFRFDSLPKLPVPSNALQDLLFEYSLLNGIHWDPSTSKIKKSKKSKLKSINSFIAFRSFYSRTISNPEQQRELSTKLAHIWKSERNQEIWNQYAQAYNNSLLLPGNKINFVDWLCALLDLKADNTMSVIENIQYNDNTPMLSGTIEDVYLIN